MLFDTQIISYCFSGYWEEEQVRNLEISSVTASEFLLFHTRENNKVDYFVLNPIRYNNFHPRDLFSMFMQDSKNSKWAKRGAKRTDSLVIDFAKEYQSYRMFGNLAISEIINNRNLNIFKLSIAHLNKSKQKLLKRKMEFILDNNILCHSVDANICNTSMQLLNKFQKNITPKENIKNTINDLLILSTAINKNMTLLTKDKVLNKFASEIYQGKIFEKEEGMIVDFSKTILPSSKNKREKNGYVNKGWSYSFTKGNI